jgi:hypothetical protein
VYDRLEDVGIVGLQAHQLVDNMVANQGYLLAFDDLMWLSGWVLLFLIPFLWLCREPEVRVVQAHGGE